jgi:hypothetical protein
VSKEYAFVDDLAALRPNVSGKGNLERFDYWLSNFQYMRSMARVCCIWADFNTAMDKVKAAETPEKKKQTAIEAALPLRKELISALSEAYRHLLATASTSGEMGCVTNLEQHTLPGLIEKPGAELAAALGEALPADAELPREYTGTTRVFVPTVRGCLEAGESLKVTVVLLAEEMPRNGSLFWRPMGEGRFSKIPLNHVARGIFAATIDKPESDIEYYCEIVGTNGEKIPWPATAPELNQTVVLGAPAA